MPLNAESSPGSTVPPAHIVGWPAELSLVLARSDSRAVTLEKFIVYPTGFQMSLSIRRAVSGAEVAHPKGMDAWTFDLDSPDSGVCLEIMYSDGTTLLGACAPRPPTDSQLRHTSEAKRNPAALVALGGTGAEFMSETDYWVAPIPPPGELTFRCEWSRAGIDLTEVTVDAAVIRDAVPRSVRLWDG